ncbi:MAG: hypothetical protein ACXVPQ_07895 [Bacteroidia bacterium]
MSKRTLYIVMMMAFMITAKAQQSLPLSPLFKPKPPLFIGEAPVKPLVADKLPVFAKYELPKGAVFCRMEEKIWHKLNVWIKLRAGNDEMYMRLINNQRY